MPTSDRLAEASDTSLLLAISRWREDALAEVYRRHASSVYGLARRVLANPAVAEEIVQEVFLFIWNQPERFDPDRGSLRSFLMALTHGRSVDRLRSDVARRKREEREARRAVHTGRPDLEHEVMNLVVSEQVKEAMASLPPTERDAIQLAYFGGHSYREVAELLDTPEGTIKSRIRAGLARLRDTLSSHAGELWLHP